MSKISLELPNSLHQATRRLAEKDRIPLDQFVTIALAEKVAALMTEDYLKERARRGDRAKFERAMAEVSDVEPDDFDRL